MKALKKIFNWFAKDNDSSGYQVLLPESEKVKFKLKLDHKEVGILYCENGKWHFKYSEQFKPLSKDYNLIGGFPDINKTYASTYLWPFFQIRIPGLKQPAIQEIITKEHIDQDDEVELLKRFGKKTISNPYELVCA